MGIERSSKHVQLEVSWPQQQQHAPSQATPPAAVAHAALIQGRAGQRQHTADAVYSRLPPHPTMSPPLPPAGSSLVKVLSNCRSSRVVSPAPLPLLAPVAVLAAEEAGGSASMTVEDARAAEGEAAAAMALALPLPELLLMAAAGAGQVGARRAAPQAPVTHGCGA